MIRFKKFCNILLGKSEMIQIMGAFDGENKNKIYNSIATQNDSFYILSVAKTAYGVLEGWDLKKNNETKLFVNDVSNSFYYSLYMSKKNKSIIFKAPIILLHKNLNSENKNIATFLSYNLKKLNITKFEFIYKWKNESLKNGSLNEIKILIPSDMDNDNFIRLINLIEGLNSLVINNDYKVWDNLIEIKKNIKIDF